MKCYLYNLTVLPSLDWQREMKPIFLTRAGDAGWREGVQGEAGGGREEPAGGGGRAAGVAAGGLRPRALGKACSSRLALVVLL